MDDHLTAIGATRSSVGVEEDLLAHLREGTDLPALRLLVVVAHPDDETVGLGGRLALLKSSCFVCVTTGAPADDAHYRTLRSNELRSCFAAARLSEQQLLPLGLADQSASFALLQLTRELQHLIQAEAWDAIITHPYEGGHPDHDATAFAVHEARRRNDAPPILEMTSYHQGPGGITTGDFLPRKTVSTRAVLSPNQAAAKSRLLDCFVSQRETLQYFGSGIESFRMAPTYDFTRAPHPGRLFYENFNWGIRDAAQWRGLADRALTVLRNRKAAA